MIVITREMWCMCWVDSWSHWGLLQRRHSRRYWLTAAQARLHAYCLFTWTFHRPQFAHESADNTVLSAKPYTECGQFHFTELDDFVICWLWYSNWIDGWLPCSTLPGWHRLVRSCYYVAVSCFSPFLCFICFLIPGALFWPQELQYRPNPGT